MKLTALSTGTLLIITGGGFAWFHLGKLIKDKSGKDIWYYVPMTLLGGLAISVGANLLASGIDDNLKQR